MVALSDENEDFERTIKDFGFIKPDAFRQNALKKIERYRSTFNKTKTSKSIK